jgi:uncharacterized SAM-binding protein YcdF (DUF218 family)
MDTVFYWASKLAWLVIAPDSLLILLILWCWYILTRGKYLGTKWLLSFITILVIAIGLFPVGEWVLYPLEKRFVVKPTLPRQIDGIIMLGGAGDQRRSSQWGMPELDGAGDRYMAFFDLARRYPNVKLVVSGGTGSMVYGKYSEADMAKLLLETQGFDSSLFIFEKQSRTTYENARYSGQLVMPREGENWILITSAFHMPRAVGVFCGMDWPVIPYPVDHYSNPKYLLRVEWGFAAHLRNLGIGVKEWVGLLAYYLSGKTDEVFPKGCG